MYLTREVGGYVAVSSNVAWVRGCAPSPPNTRPFRCRLPCVYPCSRARFLLVAISFAENEEERDRANIHVHCQASTFRCFPKSLADAGLPGGEEQETTLMSYYRCWTGRCREGGVYCMATVGGRLPNTPWCRPPPVDGECLVGLDVILNQI